MNRPIYWPGEHWASGLDETQTYKVRLISVEPWAAKWNPKIFPTTRLLVEIIEGPHAGERIATFFQTGSKYYDISSDAHASLNSITAGGDKEFEVRVRCCGGFWNVLARVDRDSRRYYF